MTMRIKYLATILVLLAVGLLPSPAQAGGVVAVCDEAHLLAALAGGGTVTFACSGTIILTTTIDVSSNTTIDGSGQNVTISGNNAVRVFRVRLGATLNLSKLTLINGSAGDLDGGGGAYNSSGCTLNISNSILSDNHSTNSGGGAIANFGTLTVENTKFSSNETTGSGGAILTWGTAMVHDSTFTGNSASAGGGGMYIYGGPQNPVTLKNSTFAGNSTLFDGGGIQNSRGSLTVSNSTFTDNSAARWGGGMYNTSNSYASVHNSTFSGNSASDVGGVYNNGSQLWLQNTIVANSPMGGNCFFVSDGGGNLSYPDATCPGINADPLLGPLQNNGGPNATMALHPGSAAINAANDANCAAPPVNNLDQRGVVRPQGAHCDIGAFEWVCPSFVPPNSVDVDDIVAMTARWGWTDATSGWDPVFDLNLDNKIDVLDIMLVTAAWGYTCG